MTMNCLMLVCASIALLSACLLAVPVQVTNQIGEMAQVHAGPEQVQQPSPPRMNHTRTVTGAKKNVTDSSLFDPLSLAGQWCHTDGPNDGNCGNSNCESWSTGNKSDGWNAGRIYCNDQGVFCWTDGKHGDCYYDQDAKCMDKSANTKVLNFTYLDDQSSSVPVPEAIFIHYIDNFLDINTTGSYNWQESIQTQYTWSWQVTSSLSVTVESEVGLPEVCSVRDSVTATVSTTQGQSQTVIHSLSWGSIQDYMVPPQKTVKLVYTVSQLQFTVPYVQTVQFGDTVAVWCSNTQNGHHFWFLDTEDVLPTSGLCDGNVCTFSGSFSGVQGVSDTVTYTYCDLGTRC